MIRTENFLSQIFFKVFLETTFVHVSWYPVHYQPKIFFGFSKSALTPRYTILDLMFPPCNAISEGRLPLCNTSSEAGALTSEVRIENDSDRKFSKSNIFQSFSGNHFCPRFMVPCSLSAENIFRFFEVRTYPSILDICCIPLFAREARVRSLPLCNTSSEAGALTSEVRIENDSDRKFSKSIFKKVFLETTFLHVSWYPVHY